MSALSREWSRAGATTLNRTRTEQSSQRCEDECAEKSLSLREGELSSFEAKKGDVVVCLRGAVWLTQSGDIKDYALRSGERFVATGKGKVVIQGLSAALLCVPQPTVHD